MLILCFLYGSSFVFLFDLLGQPVHSNDFGWLGPAPRDTTSLVDIGEVYDYENSDLSLFRFYRPLCRLWLTLNGLP